MADPNIFPTIRAVTPRVLCECIGDAVTRVLQLGRITEPCLSEHNRGAAVVLDEALEDPDYQNDFGF